MPQKILQVNFKFSMTTAEYEQAVAPAAKPIADTPGLRWKVWLMNAAGHETGGIYLFDDEAAALAFLNGPIVASVKSNPAFSEISAKLFDITADLTAITRGPVQEGVRV